MSDANEEVNCVTVVTANEHKDTKAVFWNADPAPLDSPPFSHAPGSGDSPVAVLCMAAGPKARTDFMALGHPGSEHNLGDCAGHDSRSSLHGKASRLLPER